MLTSFLILLSHILCLGNAVFPLTLVILSYMALSEAYLHCIYRWSQAERMLVSLSNTIEQSEKGD